MQFASNGETGHLRRTTLSPKDTTDRLRYRWQALALGKARCFSRDLTSLAAALQSWYEKYHTILTEECRLELHQDINKRIAVEARGTPEDTPTPLVPLTNYAEGGSTSSGYDTWGNPNVLQLLRQGAGGNIGSDADPTDQRGPPHNGQEGDAITTEPTLPRHA